MVNDALRTLADIANLHTSNNATTNNGTDLNIGRGGLNSKSQVVVYVSTADADRDLYFDLYLSLNNDSSTFRRISTTTIPKTFKGKVVQNVGQSLPWGEWADAEIMLRMSISSENHANNGDWGAVSAYLGAGEETVFGRLPTADTLVDA